MSEAATAEKLRELLTELCEYIGAHQACKEDPDQTDKDLWAGHQSVLRKLEKLDSSG